jgi:hypothetical protein
MRLAVFRSPGLPQKHDVANLARVSLLSTTSTH